MKNASFTALNSSLGTDRPFIEKRLSNQHVAAGFDALVSGSQVANMKQKGIKRIVQCISFCVTGDMKDFDPVSGLVCAAIALTGESEKVEFSRLHALCGIHREGRESAALQGVSKARLNKFLSLGGSAGTVSSKVSRTVGEAGFLTALGLVLKSDKTSFVVDKNARDSSAFLIAYASALARMTDGQFKIVTDKQA